jgi:tRNA pseudouridine38-40 synthase
LLDTITVQAEHVEPERGDGLVRVRLDLAYDGSGYSGWARQPDRPTVEGTVAEALQTSLRLPDPPALTVAGRTDAGVHARGQVCHVDLDPVRWRAGSGRSGREPGLALVARLNGLLPRAIRVLQAAPTSRDFDARFSALARRYAYRICDDLRAANPLRADVLEHRCPLDVAAMDLAGAALVGQHDFAAYCRARDGATTIRRVLALRCSRTDGLVVIDIEADAFCHSMVRAIVGALVAVGERRRPSSWPAEVLAGGRRDSAVTVMPAAGLTLEGVRYPPDDQLAERARRTRSVRSLD